MADGASEIGARVKAAHLAKKNQPSPGTALAKFEALMLEQAQNLSTIMQFTVEARSALERQTRELAQTRAELARLAADTLTYRTVIEEVKTLARDGLALERQRLAKERDAEHQKHLGEHLDERMGGNRQQAADLTRIFERLDAIDKGMKERGQLIEPPTPRPATAEEIERADR